MMKRFGVLVVLFVVMCAPGATLAAPHVSALQVGSRPTGLAFGADGTLVVSHGDSYTLTTVAADGTQGTLHVGTLPLRPVVDTGTGRLFVANRVEGTMSVVEIRDRQPVLVDTVVLGGTPAAIALDSTRHLLYIAVQPNQLLMIDGTTLQTTASVAMGWNPRGLAVDEARGRVAALSYDDSLLTWFSATGVQLNQTFVGFETRRFAGVDVRPGAGQGPPDVRTKWETIRVQTQPSAVAIDSASGRAWVTNELNAELVGVDAENHDPIRYRVGAHPRALAVLNGVAYVANWGDNTVSVVALGDGTTASVLVGYAPSAIAIDHVRNTVFVAEAGRNTLGRIDGATLAYTSFAVGRAPDELLIDPATGRVYVANHGADTVSVVSDL